jgi:hypothetical protein
MMRVCCIYVDCIPAHGMIIGLAAHWHLSPTDAQDSISYGTLGPKDTGLKTEEKLEELMRPGVKTLTVTFNAGKKGPGGKQKAKLIEILEGYVMLDILIQNLNNSLQLQPDQQYQGRYKEWSHFTCQSI